MTEIEIPQRAPKLDRSFGTLKPKISGNGPLIGVDILRHLLTVAVIYQHMLSRSRYSDAVNLEIQHWVPLFDGAVACFFLVSGYFSKPGMTRSRAFLLTRRLMTPYFIFSFIYMISLIILGKGDISKYLVRIFSGAGAGPQLYFLPYLLLITLVVTTALDRPPAAYRRLATAGLIVIFLAAYLMLPMPDSTGPEYEHLALYGLAYTLGIYRGQYARPLESIALIAIAGLAVVILPWQQPIWDLPLIILLTELAIRISPIFKSKKKRLRGSGGVYLLHTPIINFAISAALLHLGLQGMTNVAGALILTYAATLSATLIAIQLAPRLQPYLLE